MSPDHQRKALLARGWTVDICRKQMADARRAWFFVKRADEPAWKGLRERHISDYLNARRRLALLTATRWANTTPAAAR